MKTIQNITAFAAAITAVVCSAAAANAQTNQIETRVTPGFGQVTPVQPTPGYVLPVQEVQALPPVETYITPGTQVIVPPAAPKLGFTGQMVPGVGMQILSVRPHSPAANAGLENGDIVMTANGSPIMRQYDLSQALINAANYRGGVVTLRVKNIRGCSHRGNLYVTVTAYLHGQPQPVPVVAQVTDN